jgi:hypothetical protein
MGVSTDAILCYGISLEEGTILPWEEHELSLEDWWIEVVHSYKPPFEIYDEEGNYADGKEPDRETIDEYYQHRYEFTKRVSLPPVEVVHHYSYGYPMYILAVPNTVTAARRGYPVIIDTDFIVNPKREAKLIEFIKTYNIDIGGNSIPQWWLASFWEA